MNKTSKQTRSWQSVSQQRQFPKSSTSTPKHCNICQRPKAEVYCDKCGFHFTGRVRIICPQHPKTIFLMDHDICGQCGSQCSLREYSNYSHSSSQKMNDTNQNHSWQSVSQQRQFPKSSTSTPKQCNICQRPKALVYCERCGFDFPGRVRIICPQHPKTIFLMDHEVCGQCGSQCLREFPNHSGNLL